MLFVSVQITKEQQSIRHCFTILNSLSMFFHSLLPNICFFHMCLLAAYLSPFFIFSTFFFLFVYRHLPIPNGFQSRRWNTPLHTNSFANIEIHIPCFSWNVFLLRAEINFYCEHKAVFYKGLLPRLMGAIVCDSEH